jgi:diaminopimelate decarboxylase
MDESILLRLAKEHGTPLYVYDGDMVRDRFVEFRDAFKARYPKVKVCYAVKANSSLAVLKLLAREGAGADVVSGGEIYLALKAGIKPDGIVYTSNSKTPAELELALDKGVTITHCNVDELEVLAGIARKKKKTARVAFRVNPDVSPATHPKIATGLRNTKFGLHFEGDLAFEAYRMAKDLKYITVAGLHCHIGSQILETGAFEDEVKKLMDFAVRLKDELGIQLDFIDVGGGLGISYAGDKSLSPGELQGWREKAFLRANAHPRAWALCRRACGSSPRHRELREEDALQELRKR